MKEALVAKGPKVEIIDSQIPAPGPDQILIKVVVSGSNPKDWKRPEWMPSNPPKNEGDDIAGIVEAVGPSVVGFHKGDRVAAFHEMGAPGGSYAEYALAHAHAVFHLPSHTSFEEAATIPLAAITAAVGLYQRLRLPLPWLPCTVDEQVPLIIWGAATAVGSFAIKLAKLSNIHPLICVAGKGIPFVETLIEPAKGDVILDYREGNEALVRKLSEAVSRTKSGKVLHAYDAVSDKGSYDIIGKVLGPGAKLTVVLPGKDYKEVPAQVTTLVTTCGSIFEALDTLDRQQEKTGGGGAVTGNQEFGLVMYKLMARGLQEGWFRGHPYEVVPGGLNGVEEALSNLKAGKASAIKYVFRIEETAK